MNQKELEAKGIILNAAPQGEYGRRLTILTDRLGKITVFASGAAKPGSRMIGLVRPMTCGTFRLMRGRQAWNLHGVELMNTFEAVQQSYDAMLFGMYVLEVVSYAAQEGMAEEDAKQLLNLVYLTLAAVSDNAYDLLLAKHVFELRLLKWFGEYTTAPPHETDEAVAALWQLALSAPLSRLYSKVQTFSSGQQSDVTDILKRFYRAADFLWKQQIPHTFRTEAMLLDSLSCTEGCLNSNLSADG